MRGARDTTAFTWGTTADERERAFACDRLLPDARLVAWRGIDVAASPATVFRWLCQLRVAPYSYDWIDNLGRRSPRRLTAGLDHLELGQRFMSIFELADFEPGRHVTLRLVRGRRLVGDVAVTYEVVPVDPDHSRLLVKLLWHADGWRGWFLPQPAALGDLVMMRRQLLNLKHLAEAQQRVAS